VIRDLLLVLLIVVAFGVVVWLGLFGEPRQPLFRPRSALDAVEITQALDSLLDVAHQRDHRVGVAAGEALQGVRLDLDGGEAHLALGA